MNEDATVSGSVDFDIDWSPAAFECQPGPDEYVGDVGPVDVSSGSGTVPIVLERFFPACSDPSLFEPVQWEGVFHVVVGEQGLAGGIGFGGVLGLPWQATPNF